MDKICFYTERLKIRQYSQKDAQAYFQLVKEPKVHCFVDEKLDTLKEAYEKIREKIYKNDGSELAVCLKSSDEFIGTVFGRWEEDTFSVCWNFLPNYCGKGYAYEASYAYLDFLFHQMNARRIYAYVEDYNASSRHLCEKLGMRLEGEFKEFISFVDDSDGTPLYENTMQYAILKKEWDKINHSDNE